MTNDLNKPDIKDYQIKTTNKAIAELVYDKIQIIKAYNYYHGVRDRDQFAHLENNYGIGVPTSLGFTPLVRKHIDALVGEYLTNPIDPKVSCKDNDTITNIYRDKQLELSKQIFELLKTHLNNSILGAINGDPKMVEDSVLKSQLENIVESVNRSFLSNYEIASQNVVDYLIQSRDVDFINKIKDLLLDLLVGGEAYYKVDPSGAETNVNIRVLNPLNTFIDKNVQSRYIKNSYRVVVREWMSLTEILSKYGDDLTDEEIEELNSIKPEYYSANMMLVNAVNMRTGAILTDGIYAGIESTPTYPNDRFTGNLSLYPVYEVEWISVDREKGKIVENRYSTTRIGSSIYILHGKDEKAIRSADNPRKCSLRTNGIHYTDRTGAPYSLITATSNLQDQYDLLLFFRDNLFAQSGSVGSWLDVAHIPDFLGDDLPERLIKWISYAKSGLKLFDTSQDGEMLNTAFNSYDDTVKVQTMNGIDLALQRIEETASSITGVFRERLGGIEARDAVANVSMGMQQSYIITKQYYNAMDTLIKEVLIDSLNIAKIVYKKGLSGTIILGDNYKKIFTALPEHFTITDHDIQIADRAEIVKERELLKQLAIELAKSAQIDPEILIIVSTAKSLTQMKDSLFKAIEKKKNENNQLAQISQELQKVKQAYDETQKQLSQASSKLESLNENKLQLDQLKLKQDYELGLLKVNSDKDYKTTMSDLEKRRVELEALQLIDTNPRNNEVKNT